MRQPHRVPQLLRLGAHLPGAGQIFALVFRLRHKGGLDRPARRLAHPVPALDLIMVGNFPTIDQPMPDAGDRLVVDAEHGGDRPRRDRRRVAQLVGNHRLLLLRGQVPARNVELARQLALGLLAQPLAHEARPVDQAEAFADRHPVMPVDDLAGLVIFDRHEHAMLDDRALERGVFLGGQRRQELVLRHHAMPSAAM